jgi:hypothetical protein
MPERKEIYRIDYAAFDAKPHTFHFRLTRARGDSMERNVTRICMKEGARARTIRERRLRGRLLLPEGIGHYPAIILLNGSNGGPNEPRAALYASHGFATLALTWFHFQDLPPILANIPLEYLGGN